MTLIEAIRETMDCAKQIVKSYGGDINQQDRDNLCRWMEHFAKTAIAKIEKENNNAK